MREHVDRAEVYIAQLGNPASLQVAKDLCADIDNPALKAMVDAAS